MFRTRAWVELVWSTSINSWGKVRRVFCWRTSNWYCILKRQWKKNNYCIHWIIIFRNLFILYFVWWRKNLQARFGYCKVYFQFFLKTIAPGLMQKKNFWNFYFTRFSFQDVSWKKYEFLNFGKKFGSRFENFQFLSQIVVYNFRCDIVSLVLDLAEIGDVRIL